MENKGFNKLEVIIIFTVIGIFIVLGVSIAISTTTKKLVENFKKETMNIINISKNVYINLEKVGSQYLINSDNNDSTAVCVTLNGLKENNYLTNEYKNWDGYIVIEKDSFGEMRYIAWLTNGKYLIDGYTHDKINGLSLQDKTLLKSKKVDVSYDSFKGTEKEKGGLTPIATYNGKCIDEKIE